MFNTYRPAFTSIMLPALETSDDPFSLQTCQLLRRQGQPLLIHRSVVFPEQRWCLGLAQGRLDEEVISLLEAEARRVHLPVNNGVALMLDSMLAVAACEIGRDREALAALDRLRERLPDHPPGHRTGRAWLRGIRREGRTP